MSSSSVIPTESESSMDENTDSSSLPHDTNTSTSASTSSVTQSENQVACPEIEAPITLPNASWKNISTRPLQCITLCKISSVPTVSMQPDMQPVIITHCLTIESNLTWTLYVHNQTCVALECIPETLNSGSLNDYCSINCTSAVANQTLTSFQWSVPKKERSFQLMVNPVTLNGEHYQATGSCELVSKSQKCVSCNASLRTMYNRCLIISVQYHQ